MDNRLLLTWTKDLQSIAQAGLYYGKDVLTEKKKKKLEKFQLR